MTTVGFVFDRVHMAMSEAGHPNAPIFMSRGRDDRYGGPSYVGLRGSSTAGERQAFWRAGALLAQVLPDAVDPPVCERCFVDHLRNECDHVEAMA